jgi:hypothetical protein
MRAAPPAIVAAPLVRNLRRDCFVSVMLLILLGLGNYNRDILSKSPLIAGFFVIQLYRWV